MTTTQSTNIALAQSAYAAFGRGDIPAVLELMAPDISWTEAAGGPYGGTYVGPQAVVDGVFAPVGTDWTGFTVTPEEFLEAGDTVVVLGHYTGAFTATGKSFRVRFAHVVRMSEGRMAAFEQVADTRLFSDAMS